MAITAYEAAWFLPFALPICIWVAWSDMKFMKIPNKAVLALFVVFVVAGLIALPFSTYSWRFLHLVVILAVGFVLNMGGLIGAGDAKFAAAMAPFVLLGDLTFFAVLFVLVLLAAFISHRLIRAIPAARRLGEDWVSWTSRKFPMGTALGGSLACYLALGVLYGV
ncbi:MAG: hypothetical protein GY717_21115 [Rhodobacteraceae bacterium]|nr:hypothetical protein [Paracoccaceae bacterium]